MIKLLIKVWKDPVASKVIATGITLLLGSLGVYLWGYLADISIKQKVIHLTDLYNVLFKVPLWSVLVFFTILLFWIKFRFLHGTGKQNFKNSPKLTKINTKQMKDSNEEDFFVDSIASIDYSNGKAIFREYGHLWSQQPILNFKKKSTYSILFEIKPSRDALKDSKGYTWNAKPGLFFSSTNHYSKLSKEKYWVSLKSPIFIDLDTKENKVMQIQIVTVNEGIIYLGEATKHSEAFFEQGKWHQVKVDFNSNTGNIVVWINSQRVIDVTESRREDVKKYFKENPELYMAVLSWSSADFSIKNILIKGN